MDFSIVVFFSRLSIVGPAIASVLRFNKVETQFRYFLILMLAGLANEVLNYFITRHGHSNAINTNIYSLIESVLILLFFKDLKLFEKPKYLFFALLGLFLVVWLFDNLIVYSIKEFSSYFTVVSSFTYVLLCVSMINRLLLGDIKVLAKNPIFLICIGFILFYFCALIVEIFWIYGLNSSDEFRKMVYRIITVVNIVVNIILTLAVVWMPKKRKYILL